MNEECAMSNGSLKQTTQFTSRLGFYLAAVGSAVGLGNIWGFPTQTADNGGAAFVLLYLFFSLLLAWPMLVAELVIGRYGRSDPVSTLSRVGTHSALRAIGWLTGWASAVTVLLAYTFYAIITGWIICFGLSSVVLFFGFDTLAATLTSFDKLPTLISGAGFMVAVALIVTGGVAGGIEKWCARLMPMLVVLILSLIAFTLTLPGAMDGLKYFLVPDFSLVFKKDVMLGAMGQSFFSMSLGVGIMIVYGAYLTRDSNIPVMAASVAFTDTLVAVMAGMLIIPGMFVALQYGIEIYTADGTLKSADTLVFDVLPQLFSQLGGVGLLVSVAFFSLLTITALTSAISILEVPVAIFQQRKLAHRTPAAWLITAAVFLCSVVLVMYYDPLFGLVVSLVTRYAMPLLSLVVCLYVAWVWSRNEKLQELKQGFPEIERTLFWRIWPWYIRLVCPALVVILMAYTF